MKKIIIATITALTLTAAPAPPAQAHYTPYCKKSKCKRHVIKPYRATFAAIGACESGNRNWAHDPSGTYHGRYQFDLRSWRGAGGWGDPHSFGYVEQTYRAVVWLHRNGRQSWPNC